MRITTTARHADVPEALRARARLRFGARVLQFFLALL